MLKSVTKFLVLPLALPEPRKADWIDPLLSLVPPNILTLDDRSAEYDRPNDALCPGACLVSYSSLYFFARWDALKLLPPASCANARFVSRSLCCLLKAVNLWLGMNLRVLCFLCCPGGLSSLVVGAVAAGSKE